MLCFTFCKLAILFFKAGDFAHKRPYKMNLLHDLPSLQVLNALSVDAPIQVVLKTAVFAPFHERNDKEVHSQI